MFQKCHEKLAPSPPRCLPAWSGVQHQKCRQNIGPLATTLLASVERCSRPEIPPKNRPPRHHAACQRGAVFNTRNAAKHRPPRHHAACQRGAVFKTRNAAKNRPPRHHAACQRGAVFKTRNAPKNRPPRHHAACQRGAVFKTSGVREIGRFVALRTWPSSTHGALVLTRPAVGLDGGRNTEA